MQEINMTAQFDLDEIASIVARYISPSVIAQEMDVQEISECINIDVRDIAYEIDMGDLAMHLDLSVIASDVADCIDIDDVVNALDLPAINERVSNTDLQEDNVPVQESIQIQQLRDRIADLERRFDILANGLATVCRGVAYTRGDTHTV